ncbi:hypothetical protein GCM10010873_15860 [Cypionkella aquatica]|uniref:Uncharacterized protein n=1 Tax=Cypionkella aquatica TaxID=1756042 RepID=A0AA37WZR4_9RHOB|nr:hypothetical protein GCM10010873_15860 [Cypionkella aquatica]
MKAHAAAKRVIGRDRSDKHPRTPARMHRTRLGKAGQRMAHCVAIDSKAGGKGGLCG